jgi:ABC-type sugar transport system substrate-binding protein
VASGSGTFTRDLEAAVAARATIDGFAARAFISRDAAVSSEIRQLGAAIEANPRAIIVDPVSYPMMLPYLRAAHDAQIPVVVLQTAADTRNPAYVASFVHASTRTRRMAVMAGLADALARRRPARVVVLVDDWPPAGDPQLVKALSARYPDAVVKPLLMPRDTADVIPVLRAENGPLAVVALGQVGTRTLLAALLDTADRPAAVVVSPYDAAASELLERSLVDVVVGPGVCAMANAAVDTAAKAAAHDVAAFPPSVTLPSRKIRTAEPAGVPCR